MSAQTLAHLRAHGVELGDAAFAAAYWAGLHYYGQGDPLYALACKASFPMVSAELEELGEALFGATYTHEGRLVVLSVDRLYEAAKST